MVLAFLILGQETVIGYPIITVWMFRPPIFQNLKKQQAGKATGFLGFITFTTEKMQLPLTLAAMRIQATTKPDAYPSLVSYHLYPITLSFKNHDINIKKNSTFYYCPFNGFL